MSNESKEDEKVSKEGKGQCVMCIINFGDGNAQHVPADGELCCKCNSINCKDAHGKYCPRCELFYCIECTIKHEHVKDELWDKCSTCFGTFCYKCFSQWSTQNGNFVDAICSGCWAKEN